MRNVLAILSAVSLSAISSFSQSATPGTAATDSAGSSGAVSSVEHPSPALAPTIQDANTVRAEVEEMQKRRKREKDELMGQLQDYEQELKDLKAKEDPIKGEIPKVDEAIAACKKQVDEALQAMNDVEVPYKVAEKAAKEAFLKEVVDKLQAKYDGEFSSVMAKHTADTNFVATCRITPADLEDLTITPDAKCPARVIRFDSRNKHTVSGWFVTMDFERGQKVWHQIPDNATFHASVQKQNPFVADMLVHFGSDILRCGSTNVLDWDIHVYVGKDFSRKHEGKNQFFFIGVSWPADLGRRVCWQSGEPPVYDIAAKPVRAIADESTPEISKKLADWVFDDEVWKIKKNSAVVAHKAKKRSYDHEVAVRESRLQKIDKKLGDNKDKQKEVEQKIIDTRAKLEEYKDEEKVESTAPPSVGSGTGAVTNTPQEGL